MDLSKTKVLYLDYYNTLIRSLSRHDSFLIYESIWGYVELDNMGGQRPDYLDGVYCVLGSFLKLVYEEDNFSCPIRVSKSLYKLWEKRGSRLVKFRGASAVWVMDLLLDGHKDFDTMVRDELARLFGVSFASGRINHEEFGLGLGSVFSCRVY